MTGAFHIGWRYLVFYRVKTILLVGCLTLVLLLPLALRILVHHTERQLSARAEATPLLIGAKGSPLELTLNSLYFDTKVPAVLEFAEVDRVRETGLADPIPLSVRFRSREHPIVGTTLDYFEFRGLRVETGRQMQRLGECVIGAAVAEQHGLGPGDSLISSPETVFDLAGVYPLKMRIAGVLAFANSPDDRALFVDIKTGWIIEGLAHGHMDLSEAGARSGILKREGNEITANASVVQYNEVTEENIGSFHFHGDVSTFPITAVLAVPVNAKGGTLLMGRYVEQDGAVQILQPEKVVNQLLATILTVQRYVTVGMGVLGLATLATASLVFLLSLRLRRREIETLHKIGGHRAAIWVICLFEIVFVLVASILLAGMLARMTAWLGPDLVRYFL